MHGELQIWGIAWNQIRDQAWRAQLRWQCLERREGPGGVGSGSYSTHSPVWNPTTRGARLSQEDRASTVPGVERWGHRLGNPGGTRDMRGPRNMRGTDQLGALGTANSIAAKHLWLWLLFEGSGASMVVSPLTWRWVRVCSDGTAKIQQASRETELDPNADHWSRLSIHGILFHQAIQKYDNSTKSDD